MVFKKKQKLQEKIKAQVEQPKPILLQENDIAGGMSFFQYKQHIEEDETWAPGWLAIEQAFETVYGVQAPKHYGTILTSRAILGGSEFLDGYSFYTSPKDYQHLITYGMSNLYANPEYFKQTYSRWGYEMTMKLYGEPDELVWACNMLGNLARYTYTNERFFEDHQYVLGDGSCIQVDSDSSITSLIIVRDPELPILDSVHGRLEFLLMVGVTWDEITKIRDDTSLMDVLIERMKADDNPDLVTDMKRTKSYL